MRVFRVIMTWGNGASFSQRMVLLPLALLFAAVGTPGQAPTPYSSLEVPPPNPGNNVPGIPKHSASNELTPAESMQVGDARQHLKDLCLDPSVPETCKKIFCHMFGWLYAKWADGGDYRTADLNPNNGPGDPAPQAEDWFFGGTCANGTEDGSADGYYYNGSDPSNHTLIEKQDFAPSGRYQPRPFGATQLTNKVSHMLLASFLMHEYMHAIQTSYRGQVKRKCRLLQYHILVYRVQLDLLKCQKDACAGSLAQDEAAMLDSYEQWLRNDLARLVARVKRLPGCESI